MTMITASGNVEDTSVDTGFMVVMAQGILAGMDLMEDMAGMGHMGDLDITVDPVITDRMVGMVTGITEDTMGTVENTVSWQIFKLL